LALTILYFAAAREAAGTSRESLPSVPATVGELRAALCSAHPKMSRILPRCRIAVNEAFADDSAPLKDGAEIAIVPPVAGGAPEGPTPVKVPLARFAVLERPLDLLEVVDAVAENSRGGLVTFTGIVRDVSHGRRVLRLEYEAYVPMAERTLTRIGEELGQEHGALVAIRHRIGVLSPGESAVVIACSAPHRTPAFRACEAAIERLKRDVPIWKREVFEDGSQWVGMGP
jgi:molybdopterin synthase catalytic subunit